jgi:hypothetical protein
MIYIFCNIDIINIALIYQLKQTKTNKHDIINRINTNYQLTFWSFFY